VLKRCCGTGAIDDTELNRIIMDVNISPAPTTNVVMEESKLEEKLGEVNMEVLETEINDCATENAQRIFGNHDELSKYSVALYKILNALDWKQLMPSIKKLDWENAEAIVPADVEILVSTEDNDDSLSGELKSIAGFSIKSSWNLSVKFREKPSDQERQITQDEIDKIIVDTKMKRQLTEIQNKQVQILNDLNRFVWQQKPRKQGTYPTLQPQFHKFLTMLTKTTIRPPEKATATALQEFRKKYAAAKPVRDELLDKNKKKFIRENASHLLTPAFAKRVMALVAARVEATARPQAPP
jgi:hypothetical protein